VAKHVCLIYFNSYFYHRGRRGWFRRRQGGRYGQEGEGAQGKFHEVRIDQTSSHGCKRESGIHPMIGR
jgi:hypothetical protein